MLTHKSTRFLFVLLLAGILLVDYFYAVNILFYPLLLLGYVIALAYGSMTITANFFLKAFNNGPTTDKVVSITFDDGPHLTVTPEVLNVLKAFNAKASFFLIGNKIKGKEDVVSRILEEGHLIGNHTWTHDHKFGFFSKEKVAEELQQTKGFIEEQFDKKVRFFRPPAGVTNPRIKAVAKAQNYDVIGWNIRSLDTVIKSEQKVFDRIKRQIKPGGIILIHDIFPNTATLVEKLLIYLQKTGYQVIPLDQLINRKPYE